MTIETTRFGRLDVDPRAVITVPRGLIGFPPDQRFTLIEHAPNTPFRWLQSVDDPALALVVMEPHAFFPEYEVDIPDADAELLGLAAPEEARVLTTVTIQRAPREVTTNLLGPLIVGLGSGRAVQLVLGDDRYTTRMPLPTRDPGSQSAQAASAAQAA